MAKGKFNGQAKPDESTPAAASGTALSGLEGKSDTDKVVIVSEKRKGKTIVGIEKTPVVFDADGKATVTAKEARYFLSVPGCTLEGAKNTASEKKTESAAKTDSAEEKKASEKEGEQ